LRVPRDRDSSSERYERTDVRPRVVLASAGGLVLTVLVILVAITAFESMTTGVAPSVSRPEDLIQGLQAAPTPAEPRLEAQSGVNFEAYHAAAEQRLDTYRWVDRDAGVVAIPIDRAMDMVAQQGLPARSGANPSQDDGATSPSGASAGRVEETYP
jgi:hypothetical protein